MRPPTDYEILKEIYDRYREEFANYIKGAQNRRDSKIFVPIDVDAIGEHFGVDADSVFGRLYYHLEPKFGDSGKTGETRKMFFSPVAGGDRNCVNFPHLEAVLAGLWQERRRNLWAISIAGMSFLVAAISVTISAFALAG